MVPATNFELYYLSSVSRLLKAKDGELELKLFLPFGLEKNLTPELKNLYSGIDFFQMPALTPKISKNPVKMLFNVLENLRQYRNFKRQAKKTVEGCDIICIAGIKEFFANVLCKISPKDVRLVALRTANEEAENPALYQKRPLLSFFLNIKNFLFGYSVMEYKWRAGLKFSLNRILSNVDSDLITKNFVRYPYHRTISITDYDIGKKGQNFRLPPSFRALKEIYRIEDDSPSILVAGDQTPLYSSWDAEDQKRYDEFFNYMRENFKDYKLYFKGKKRKTDISQYNLDGFEVLDPGFCLEEICLKKNIKKVISIRSSSSKIASWLGVSGYLLYPLFKMPEALRKIVENENCDMRSIIRINNFEDLNKDSNHSNQKYNINDLVSLYWEAIVA